MCFRRIKEWFALRKAKKLEQEHLVTPSELKEEKQTIEKEKVMIKDFLEPEFKAPPKKRGKKKTARKTRKKR